MGGDLCGCWGIRFLICRKGGNLRMGRMAESGMINLKISAEVKQGARRELVMYRFLTDDVGKEKASVEAAPGTGDESTVKENLCVRPLVHQNSSILGWRSRLRRARSATQRRTSPKSCGLDAREPRMQGTEGPAERGGKRRRSWPIRLRQKGTQPVEPLSHPRRKAMEDREEQGETCRKLHWFEATRQTGRKEGPTARFPCKGAFCGAFVGAAPPCGPDQPRAACGYAL
ncbi:hypothetical protein VTK26DRAFT_516 [Humicola hyalothermophila]